MKNEKIFKAIDTIECAYNKKLEEKDRYTCMNILNIFNEIIEEINHQVIYVLIEPFYTDFDEYINNLLDYPTDIIQRWEYNNNYLDDDYITMNDDGNFQTFNYNEFYNIYEYDIFHYTKILIDDYNVIMTNNMKQIIQKFNDNIYI